VETITFIELQRVAIRLASILARYRGERAVLLYPSGINFVRAILGCFYAGVVAVPAPIPNAQGGGTTRLKRIIEDSGARIILTDSKHSGEIHKWMHEANLELTYLEIDTISLEPDELIASPPVSSEYPAFIQYTSGSTSEPKGVVVHHGAIMANALGTMRGFGMDQTDITVSWLPMFHDMGLVGMTFQPLMVGISSIIMSPMTFLKRPQLWLQALSKYSATISGGPNFAFDLCAQRIQEHHLKGVDLSQWRVAFNGSEPVRATSYRAFCERFSTYGFNPTAFRPVYGLAESTLHVTTSRLEQNPTILYADTDALETKNVIQTVLEAATMKRELVGCGTSNSLELAIVDPKKHERLPERRVGEIWIRGESIAKGYWQKPKLSSDVFHNTLDSQDNWLRTGDLGFLYNNELFVTGRIKELIIVNGRNIYPQDVEMVVQRLNPILRAGAGAAFMTNSNHVESLSLVQEVTRDERRVDWKELAIDVRAEVAQEFAVQLDSIVFIRQSSLKRTTSGKIRRLEMRRQFIADELDVIYQEISKETTIARQLWHR
jgi:acyl-CoA synthetase (AMP-forming)/AMP-acid ligase II